MKVFIFLTISICSFAAFAVQAGPQARKSNYYYFELVPKEKLELSFQSDKICSNNTDKIQVDEFDSTAAYPSVEKKGKVPVRIKNIFVESFSVCSNNPIGKIEKKIVIGPFPKQMTHIRITASDGIQVAQVGEACDAKMTKVMGLLADAGICSDDSDCIITQAFSEKLFCGKNKAINKKADAKKIISAIDLVQNCPQGGSCLFQDLKEPVKVKCIAKQCQVME